MELVSKWEEDNQGLLREAGFEMARNTVQLAGNYRGLGFTWPSDGAWDGAAREGQIGSTLHRVLMGPSSLPLRVFGILP